MIELGSVIRFMYPMDERNIGEYKAFSKAAKDVGFDKDERKLGAMDPGILLEGTSEELKRQVAPEMLTSFLKSLRGDSHADPRHMLEAGNFLYSCRSDQRDPRNRIILNDKENRLVGLACHLVENALYEGKLEDLTQEQAAALAFTANVSAKLIEQGSMRSEGWYDTKKFKKFVSEVREFKKEQLSAMFHTGDQVMSAGEIIQEYEGRIVEELGAIEGILQSVDWNDEISGLRIKIDKAFNTIQRSESPLRYTIDELRELFDEWMIDRPRIITYMQTEFKAAQGYARGNDRRPHDYRDFSTFLCYSRAQKPFSQESDRYFGALKRLKAVYSEKRDLDKAKNPNKKREPLKDFASMRQAFAESSLPDAFETLKLLFELKDPGLGSVGTFMSGMRKVSRTISSRDSVKMYDRSFSVADQSLMRKESRPATIPYFIKSYLITSAIMKRWKNHPYEGFTKLAQLGPHSPYGVETAGKVATFSFLENNGNGGRRVGSSSPSYSDLHYITEDIPFVVWAMKYVQSKGAPENNVWGKV